MIVPHEYRNTTQKTTEYRKVSAETANLCPDLLMKESFQKEVLTGV